MTLIFIEFQKCVYYIEVCNKISVYINSTNAPFTKVFEDLEYEIDEKFFKKMYRNF